MSRLADAARAYIGVRFRHRGRSRTELDCAGLCVLANADCGVRVPDFLLYGREPFQDGLVQHTTAALGEPVAIAPVAQHQLQDGDVILLRYHTNPHHMAIVGEHQYGDVAALTLIHADGVHGRVLEQRMTPDVIARITHVFRRPV